MPNRPATTVCLDENPSKRPRYEAPIALPPSSSINGASVNVVPNSARGKTPGSGGGQLSRGSISNGDHTSFFITAVSENRNREIGICAVDLVSPHELLVWNITDSHHYAETISLLMAYQYVFDKPTEILVLESIKPRRLNEEISQRFARSTCRIVPLARKYFDQTKGAEDLKRAVMNNTDINMTRNYVLMAALACLMRYVEFIQGVYIAEKTMKLVINASTKKLLLDHATIASLELVINKKGDSNRETLFAKLNNTQTSAGNRLLRATMLRPCAHLKTIQSRHEVIGLFLDNPAWFFDVLEQLPNLSSMDQLLGQLVVIPKVVTPHVSRAAIGNVIALKHALEIVPKLASCLETTASQLSTSSSLLTSIIHTLKQPVFEAIHYDINEVINERVQLCRSVAQKRIQECFAIRAGMDGMLDVARRTYLETIDKIHQVVHKYKESIETIPIKLQYTSRRGYHLALSVEENSQINVVIPSLFVDRVQTRKVLYCTTRELACLNERSQESLTAVYKLSNEVIQNLLDKIRPHASALYTMVESIALLDMLLSFTNTVALSPTEQPYVKPQLSDSNDANLVIKQGRHPVVEKALRDRPFVANDTFFSSNRAFHILTGPNCAGKSTYLRSVAVITILAHMGCYVPAAQAFIPLRDRILTRFGTSDDLEENASTFTVEMKETAFILEYATSKSLVLMDELGRGTQNEEGIAIAWAVSEELIKRKSYTCFATHYHDLHELACMYSSCHNYHMGTTATSVNQIGQMQYLYQLFDGPSPLTEMYGIQMASVCGLPAELIEDAKKIHQKLVQAKKKDSQQRAQQLKQTDQRMILSPSEQNQLADQIRAIFQANLEPHALRRQLQHLREKYPMNPKEAKDSNSPSSTTTNQRANIEPDPVDAQD